MYKTVNFLFVLFLSVLLFSSCEKEPILEVSQSSLTFIDQGGPQSISFSTNKEWTASVSGGTGWCTITPASGNSNIKTITVTTVANTTHDDRTATISIIAGELSKVITITQSKNRAIILTKDSYEVGTSGGNISVEINSNIEYDVTIPTENQTWITNTTTKGLATSTLTFAIAANSAYDSRKGKIIIKDKATALADTVHVTQSQKDAIILTQKTFNIADTLIVVSAELKSNTSYIVTIPSAAQLWIKQLQTKALKTESLQFEVARNTTLQARSAEIIILKSLTTLADTLVINQAKAPSIPSLTTYDAYNVTSSSVSTGGNVTYDGGGEVLSRGICWSKNDNPTIKNSKTNNGKGTGTFTADLTGLEPVTKYYARSYATNRAGTGYGNIISFTTLVAKPTVITSVATQITKNSVVTGGNITSNGGASIIDRGVCWSLGTNPTTANSKTSNGTGIGLFVSNIENLEYNKTYYIRAYAINSAGTTYGEQIVITTLKGEPTVNIQGINVTYNNTAELSCFVSYDGGAEVSSRGVCWSINSIPTINNSKTINGMGSGSFTTQITDLLSNSTYYFRAYATNAIGTSYSETLTVKTYGSPVSDNDGNTYSTIKIGNQTWMAENLKTTKYRNGETIGSTSPSTLNIALESNPKYQWPVGGDESKVAEYGRLYTWYAATDSRGICPDGWHLPSEEEIDILVLSAGGKSVAGNNLKIFGTNHWGILNLSATNITGFSAKGGGYRDVDGNYIDFKRSARFLGFKRKEYINSSNLFHNIVLNLFSDYEYIIIYNEDVDTPKYRGHSVRCVKD